METKKEAHLKSSWEKKSIVSRSFLEELRREEPRNMVRNFSRWKGCSGYYRHTSL